MIHQSGRPSEIRRRPATVLFVMRHYAEFKSDAETAGIHSRNATLKMLYTYLYHVKRHRVGISAGKSSSDTKRRQRCRNGQTWRLIHINFSGEASPPCICRMTIHLFHRFQIYQDNAEAGDISSSCSYSTH